jgi:hypothetical protein
MTSRCSTATRAPCAWRASDRRRRRRSHVVHCGSPTGDDTHACARAEAGVIVSRFTPIRIRHRRCASRDTRPTRTLPCRLLSTSDPSRDQPHRPSSGAPPHRAAQRGSAARVAAVGPPGCPVTSRGCWFASGRSQRAPGGRRKVTSAVARSPAVPRVGRTAAPWSAGRPRRAARPQVLYLHPVLVGQARRDQRAVAGLRVAFDAEEGSSAL